MTDADLLRARWRQAWAVGIALLAVAGVSGTLQAQSGAPKPAAGVSQAAPGVAAKGTSSTTSLPSVTVTAPVPAAAPPAPPPKPAKQLFGAMTAPADLTARALGSYAKGCLAGARALPVDGPAWQAMRLSRNRNWGHPQLIALIERFAGETQEFDGWSGLLVGDISQPRGGPMLTGHNSHQIGLDADIWFTPMPDRRLSGKERENLSATSMLGPDKLSVDRKIWSPAHVQVVKRAASYPEVERVLVHPAIKKALCESAGTDREWLGKVRPIWGHHYHFHIRIGCPQGSTGCVPQAPPPKDDGCGKELADWFALLTRPPQPKPPKPTTPVKPPPPKPELTLDQLPAECKAVLEAGFEQPAVAESAGAAPPAAAAPAAAGVSASKAVPAPRPAVKPKSASR